jgi:uncharacterized protein with von Willebrand factor type A (vWA) domain
MPTRETLGGIVHAYQKYDPVRIPPPRPADTNMVASVMEHALMFGDLDELTDEQLADAIILDPEQIRGVGPSLAALRQMLEERRRKILQNYETQSVQRLAREQFHGQAREARPPKRHASAFEKAVNEEQLRRLERLWYAVEDDHSPFAVQLVRLLERLSTVYEVDELAARWSFSGRERLSVEKAIEVKQELEQIEELLRQLEEAAKNGKVGLVDLDSLGRMAAEDGATAAFDDLQRLRQQVQQLVEQMAAEQGLEKSRRGYQLTPKALRVFQGKLLEQIFSAMSASRTGRHEVRVSGEGAVELIPTRPYEFGDSVAHMDIPGSLVNAMLRAGPARQPGDRLRLEQRDIEVHHTRNTPKAATSVVLDMSGSMRHGGLYVGVKRMALALQGLVQREFPGDFLQFIEMASFARPKAFGELIGLLPKPVTLFDPVVRLRADMADPRISEQDVPPHFTNIQHALSLSRRHLTRQDTPNRQVILITDGLPTAHFEGSELYLLYPPHRRTEEATMREAEACRREGIVINIFLLSGWSQSSEDIQFAYRLAQRAHGRVFFAAGRELDRFVVWDYLEQRRSIIG